MAKKQCTCTICGSQFEFKARKANLYCGMPCYRVAQRRGDYKRGSKLAGECTHCGAIVRGKDMSRCRDGRKADNLFCDRACYDKHRAEIRAALRKPCAHCGEEFQPYSPTTKYCSWGCRVDAKRAKPTHCVNCGCWFTAMKAIRRKTRVDFITVNNGKTCSDNCLREWASRNPDRREKISKAFRADKHPNWQGGSHYGGTRGPGWQRIAEKCREQHGRKCKHCGMTETESKERGWGRLQVNHIVPFHQWQNKRKANAQSNLEALCKSCHSKADWKWRKENSVQMSLPIFK